MSTHAACPALDIREQSHFLPTDRPESPVNRLAAERMQRLWEALGGGVRPICELAFITEETPDAHLLRHAQAELDTAIANLK